GNERDFGVVSNGYIPAYMSPGPSYTSHGPLHMSPASTAHKSLPLANRHKLCVRRTPLKLQSSMRCYYRKERVKDAAKKVVKDAAKDTHLDAVTTMSIPMTTTEDTIHTHLDASDAAQETGHTEEDLQFIRMEKSDKPNFDLCETSFWDILYSGGEKADYLEQEKLGGNRPRNAHWTLGLSELVAFHIDSGKMMSMVSVMDDLRATIDGTNPRYPSGTKSHKFFPINLDNKHWVAASWNFDDYVLTVYDSLESPSNYSKIIDLLKTWKDFIKKDLENMDWLENTKRDSKCFKISLRYMNNMPKQSSVYGTLDCGVMTCKFIEMLTNGKTIDIKSFGDNVGLKCQEYRAKMALMMYETRCEGPV
ncbi:phospholipase-like protein, partial [Tanacetum coccineum]